MNLFNKQQQLSEKELESRVKENFCNLKGIVACDYYNKIWCLKTCEYYKKIERQGRYWN